MGQKSKIKRLKHCLGSFSTLRGSALVPREIAQRLPLPAPWDSEAISLWGEIVKRYLTGVISTVKIYLDFQRWVVIILLS